MTVAQKNDFPRHLGTLAKVLYSEMGIGPTREELELLARVQYPQVSALEIDEALLQLTGRTPQHKKRYIWCDAKGCHWRLLEEQDPYLRALIIVVVQCTCDCEGANLYDVVTTAVRHAKVPQDTVLECLKGLQGEKLLVDEEFGCGKFVLNPLIPEEEYLRITSVLPRGEVSQGARP